MSQAALREVVFHVRDLACRACARHAEGALRQVEGVQAARVGFLSEVARVRFDACRTSARRIALGMERAGFQLGPAAPAGGPRVGLRAGGIALLLSGNLAALSWVPRTAAPALSVGVVKLALAALVIGLGGVPTARRAWAAGRRGVFDGDGLAALAVVVAFAAGVGHLALGSGARIPAWAPLDPGAWRGAGSWGFESAAAMVLAALAVRAPEEALRAQAIRLAPPRADHDAGMDADVRHALARLELWARPPDGLEIARRAVLTAALGFAIFAALVHACLGGGLVSPMALFTAVAVLAGFSSAAFGRAPLVARSIAILRARAAGVLVKDASELEALARVDRVMVVAAGGLPGAPPAAIVLMDVQPGGAEELRRLGRALRARLREGAIFGALYNAIVIPLAVLGRLSPLAATALMLGSSLLLLGNCARLLPAASEGATGEGAAGEGATREGATREGATREGATSATGGSAEARPRSDSAAPPC
jgi:cation transport ATPase